MGTKDRKKRERKFRREQILQAAVELLSERGFEKTTMDEIAEHAELSKGTLYFYFHDKSDLYMAIQKQGLHLMHQEFLEILREDEPGAVLVKKMGKSFLNFIEKYPVYTQALSLHRQNPPDDVKEIEQLESEMRILTTRALQIGIQDGSIQTDTDPKILAIQIGFCLRGILQFHISNRQSDICQVLEENQITVADTFKLIINALLNQIDIDSETLNNR